MKQKETDMKQRENNAKKEKRKEKKKKVEMRRILGVSTVLSHPGLE